MHFLSKPANPRIAPLLFGYAPPRRANEEAKTQRITRRRVERLSRMNLDALILYDVQDESARTSEERPFPYLPTIDPLTYSRDYLNDASVAGLPRIVYRAVARHSREENERFLRTLDPRREAVVLVGSPSSSARQATTLRKAYEIYSAAFETTSGPPPIDRPGVRSRPLLGGVAIPERHGQKGDEHLRVEQKMRRGCSFFVSQCIYDAEAARNFLSDYHYHLADRGERPARMVLTLSPCGSEQTLRFMEWLGISFPRWLENDLERSGDILDRSMAACVRVASELADFCIERSIPFGFNVESVSIRKVEIDAAEELVSEVGRILLDRGLRATESSSDRR